MSAVSTGTVQALKEAVSEFFVRTYSRSGRDKARYGVVERRLEQLVMPMIRHEPFTAELLVVVGRVLQILKLNVYPQEVRALESRLRGILGR